MSDESKLKGVNIGFAMTGSFCVFSKVIPQMKRIVDIGGNIVPIFSETVYKTTTRFYDAEDLYNDIKEITGKDPIHDIVAAEPIGPKNLCDIMIVAPCTGNTMAKMANGIVDSCALMSAKSVQRNNGKVILAISSNDALKLNAVNLGKLLGMKNIYFVPFGQDNYVSKPSSMVADMDKIIETCIYALDDKQIQPMLLN